MKRTIIALLAVTALSSCTFIRIDTKALKAILEKEGVDMTMEAGSPGKAISASGVEVREIRDIPEEFHAISSHIPIDIEYSDGEQFVEITASDNLMPYISTTVRDGVLKLQFDGVRVRNAKDMKVVIRTPRLDSVSIGGAGDLELEGLVRTDDFRIEVNGAGDVDIDSLEASSFTLRVNGAGDIDAETIRCTSFDVNVSGSGDIDVEHIDAETIKVNISGAGDCTLAGRAQKGDFSVSGAGSVDIRNLKVDDVQSSMNGMAKIFR